VVAGCSHCYFGSRISNHHFFFSFIYLFILSCNNTTEKELKTQKNSIDLKNNGRFKHHCDCDDLERCFGSDPEPLQPVAK